MQKKNYSKIGDIAKIYNISVQTLRHYEDIGLISPAYVDADTHYRYYSYEQTEILNTIRYLRALGTPLNAINEFLNNRSLEKMENMLFKQNKDVEKQIQILQRAQKKIQRRIKVLHNANHTQCNIIQEFDAPSLQYISIPTKLQPSSYLDLEASIMSLEKHQRETIVYLGNVGLGISKERLIQKEFEQYDSVFIVLYPEDDYDAPSMTIPCMHTISITFHGHHNSSKPYYEMLLQYMQQNNYEPTFFSREITLIDEGLTKDKSQHLTQIEIPVTERTHKQ